MKLIVDDPPIGLTQLGRLVHCLNDRYEKNGAERQISP